MYTTNSDLFHTDEDEIIQAHIIGNVAMKECIEYSSLHHITDDHKGTSVYLIDTPLSMY